MAESALIVEEREGFGLATVMARRGVAAEVIGAALGVTAPSGPRWSGDERLALLGVGPGVWLALEGTAAGDAAAHLAEALTGLASVSDQSGGYVIFRLSGAGARTVLQRGAAIDFHPDAFGHDTVAVTVISHIGAIVRQTDDRPAFEVAVFRSYAESFRHWLHEAAAAL